MTPAYRCFTLLALRSLGRKGTGHFKDGEDPGLCIATPSSPFLSIGWFEWKAMCIQAFESPTDSERGWMTPAYRNLTRLSSCWVCCKGLGQFEAGTYSVFCMITQAANRSWIGGSTRGAPCIYKLNKLSLNDPGQSNFHTSIACVDGPQRAVLLRGQLVYSVMYHYANLTLHLHGRRCVESHVYTGLNDRLMERGWMTFDGARRDDAGGFESHASQLISSLLQGDRAR